MNFEHHMLLLLQHWDNVQLRTRLLLFLSYEGHWLQWKLGKLKLGKITFEIKEVYSDNFLLYEEVRVRFIRQDNTEMDESSLEAWVDYFSWHWDIPHILALLIFLKLIWKQVKIFLYWRYLDPWMFLFTPSALDSWCSQLLFTQTTIPPFSHLGKKYFYINQWATDLVIDLGAFYGIFL